MALVHVSRRLVEITERGQLSNQRQHIGGGELDVGGDIRTNVFLHTSNIKIDLGAQGRERRRTCSRAPMNSILFV